MTNQVFLLMKVHYEKTGEILSSDRLIQMNMNPQYVVDGIMQFDHYLDERRRVLA
ncbi:hypothetical protein GLV98_12340 [Halobacillus litoralis]|uniref:Uncharacterized protein n=1 Tax=Halobacillus litoralis TaxID=45668 RepID=A0A845EGE6_9BACI|nr:hypothetical protein [Halobacillus litoralis]MYL50278.1 hypothetical protein [Halobacillus litoralis]